MRKQRITVLRERHLRTLEDKPPCFIKKIRGGFLWRMYGMAGRFGKLAAIRVYHGLKWELSYRVWIGI